MEPRRSTFLAWLLPLAILVATARPAGAAAQERFRSATVCAPCHEQIYRSWRESQHASAFTEPMFLIPYNRIRQKDPGRARSCEQCHNPMRSALRPGDPRAALFAQEGVTCDFCHSAASVRSDGRFPRYRLEAGSTFGPYDRKREESPHRVVFSPLHLASEFCAGCHEFWTEYGVPVLTTYSEWAESFYRGTGVHCQYCHLPELFGAGFLDNSGRAKGPPDHGMVGGHSRERLAKALPLRAVLEETGATSRVTVRVKNETVGHKAPTGIPMHRIRLVTTAFDEEGRALGRKEEVFERVLGDGAGNPLSRPEEIFLEAREVLKDNRLAPKEERRVVHDFPSGPVPPATAQVTLTYEIPTPDTYPALGRIEVPVAHVVVSRRPGIFPGAAAGLALLAAIALSAAIYLLRRGRGTG